MSSKPSSKRLEETMFKLRSLLNITLAINDNLPQDELLNRYENLLKNDLNIGKLILFIYQDSWKCILNTGVIDASQIDVEKNLSIYNQILTVSSGDCGALENGDIVIPIQHNNKYIAYVILGDLEESTGISPVLKHLNFIQTLTNIIIVAIENMRLFKESLHQEAMRKELELASRMQNMLIPNAALLPKTDKISISTFYHPHLEVGGDYYDYLKLSANEIGFCIADVSGKGISAAIIMSNFQANLRALFTHTISLTDLVIKLNERVISATNGEKFITLFIAKFNLKTRELVFVNAGHNHPILYLKNQKTISFLVEGCVGIGMLDEIPSIKQGSLTLDGPAKILCYTDGLVEMIDESGVSSGTEDLEKALNNDNSIDANIQNIIEDQAILTGSVKIFDDISIIGIEIF